MKKQIGSEFQRIDKLVQASRLPEEEKQAAAGCLKKLPPLCEAFFQSYESRDVEEIMYLERGLLARLADPAQPSRQARDFAKVLSVRLKNLHERLGLPELKLKLKIG
jgi:hypothetical protein